MAEPVQRRLAMLLIFLVVVTNLADRQVINILAQDIKISLRLSDTELGLLTGAAFGVIYALVGVPAAWLADRRDRPRVIAVMVAIWSIGTIFCAFAGAFAALFLARMVVGAGEAGSQPACSAFVRDLAADKPTSGLAVMMAGNPVGSCIGLLAGGLIAEQWGWRAAFILVGAPGLLLAVALLGWIRDIRPAGNKMLQYGHWWSDSINLARRPFMPILIFASAASLLITYVGSAWLPAFFIRTHGLSTGEIGTFAALATGIGGGAGALGALLCDRLRPWVPQIESKYLITNFLLLIPSILWTVTVVGRASALTGLVVFSGLSFAWLAPTTRLIQDAVEPHERALAFAICGGVGALFSLGFGIPLVGLMSDHLPTVSGLSGLSLALAMLIPSIAAIAATVHALLMMRLNSDPITAS